MKRVFLGLGLTLLVAACSDGVGINPAPLPPQKDSSVSPSEAGDAPSDVSAEPSKDAGVADSDAKAPEAGPVRRQVYRRSPFGNLEQTGNLMYDGDFEFSAPGGQNAWIAISPIDGQVDLPIETGGLCRSGLRCGVLKNTYDLLGDAVAATNAPLQLSVWARVPADDCLVLSITMISRQLLMGELQTPLEPDSLQPDDTGWCHYQGVYDQRDEGVGVYITQTGLEEEQVILIDDVTLVAADGQSPLSWQAPKPQPEIAARARAALEWRRKHLFFGRRTIRE